ncbi:MAG: hypothetical protein KGQ46_00855 [Hyphomicrobiales bacterium]|nr:hypothetical protein [Hyphomicrobiales bacterium]MDE2114822.1 hypothetical protein [Hyphomicrobiales bacterium]
MFKVSSLPVAVALVCAGLAFGAGAAFAQPVHHRSSASVHHPRGYFVPPVIHGRNFMDSGSIVPEGSLNQYYTVNTYFARSPTQTYRPDSFGDDLRPNSFTVPGTPQPLFEF